MAHVKTAISLESALFKQINSLARDLKVSRSKVVVLALEDYIRRRQNLRLLEQINEAYRGPADAEERRRLRQARRSHRRIVEGEW